MLPASLVGPSWRGRGHDWVQRQWWSSLVVRISRVGRQRGWEAPPLAKERLHLLRRCYTCRVVLTGPPVSLANDWVEKKLTDAWNKKRNTSVTIGELESKLKMRKIMPKTEWLAAMQVSSQTFRICSEFYRLCCETLKDWQINYNTATGWENTTNRPTALDASLTATIRIQGLCHSYMQNFKKMEELYNFLAVKTFLFYS